MADGPSVLDQAMGTDQQPTQAAPTAAPTAGGSVLDQALQSDGQEAKKNVAATTPDSPYSWLERAEGEVMQHVPLAEDNSVLSWVNKHVVQPPVRAGEETGKILANRGLKGLAYGEQAASDVQSDLFGDGKQSAEIPSWAKGMEGDYLKQKFEETNPRIAGVASSTFGFLGQIVGNPTNWPLMGGAAAKSALMKTFTKAFGAQMGAQAIDSGKQLWDNWDDMSTEERWKAMTDLVIQTATARSALKGHAAVTDKTEAKASKVRVAGEEPTSKNIAGINIPLSQQHAEAIAGPKNMPVAETDSLVHVVKEHQRLATAPAATAAMHSVLGQSAEDLINQHESILNAEPLPEQVAGKNQPSKYATIDDASNALNEKATSTTYAKADEISSREQQEHQQKVQSALDSEKAGVDHYNQMVDEHNASLGEDEKPMEHIQFDPSKIQADMETQRPKTYGELKGAVDRAYKDLNSPDAEIRENAVDAIDKSEKQLDQWFKQHSDEISPEEYTSAKKLVYAGARFQEIANGLRAGVENDNLSGNKLRSIIASIDNRMIKRGEAPGAFRRLVGDSVYKNWRDVARLFDPINKAPMGARTVGRLALHFAAHHFFGPLGLVGKVGMHWLMDRVLSSPEWGNWFKDMSDSVREKYQKGTEIPGNILTRFKSLWDGSRQEGAAGAKISPRTVGSPVPPKFGRGGLGSSVLDSAMGDEQLNAHNENGGSTFDINGKDLNGVNKFSVGSYPERAESHTDLDEDKLQSFRDRNADVLSLPDHAVGTWKDGNKHVLDVSKLYGDRDEAVAAGRAANQKSIYHLGSGELVNTEGTGEVPNSVRDVVSSYNKGIGKPEVQDIKTPVNSRMADAIADAYDQLKHDPKNPKVKRAYNALIKETVDQWHALQDRGYRLEVKSQDPYGLDSTKPAYQEMAEDVKNNRRIQVWDGGKPPADHPLSQVDPETGLAYNTLFRAVHDIMGHVAGDNDFSQQGEENAYQRHAQSYSKDAVPALTTETRGQTSHYFNNERVRNGGQADFVDQRAALLPEKFYAGDKEPSRKWPTGDALIKKYGSADDPAHVAFLLSDGRNVAQTGTEHDRMLGGVPKDDLRTPYVNETGSIRMRAYGAYGDRQFGISMPESGITQEQLAQLEKWAPQMRTGRIFLEVAHPDGAHSMLEQGSDPDLTAEIKKLVPIKGDNLSPNASGESAASQEAISRQASEKSQGITRVKVLRSGQEIPLIGPDAVDVAAGPGETVVKRFADGHEEIQDQGQGARYTPRDPQADALKRMSATNDNDWMAQARTKLGPDASISQIAMEAARLKTAGATAPKNLEASEIATRRPTSRRVEKTNASGQYADMNGVRDASQAQPGGDGKLGYAEKLARTVSKYSGLNFTDAELKNPRAVMEKFINHMTDNLVYLHNAIPEPMRETARQWYDTAHKMSKTMADKYGISHEQAAGVLAALSPQNAWDNNVALGDRLLDTYKNRQNFEFSPKMEAAIAKVKGGQLSKAGRGILKDIQGKTLAEIAGQPMPERLRKKWGSEADNKWANVKAAQQGMWVRLYDEAHNAPENPMFHPSGEVVGVSPNNRSWIGLDHVAKAIRIVNDGSVENINDVMGGGNKIRNFYNNIINPDSKNGHVTVDTHAVGAAHFQPFSGDDAEVQHNFGNTPKGIPGAPKHAATGMRGTYPLYAEAYRRAAEKLGVKPRELQSMTWEGIRSLMGDNKKTPELKALAQDVWKKVQDRELTIKQAREMIIEQAGGFSKPSWMTDEQWDEATGAGFDPESFAAAGGSK